MTDETAGTLMVELYYRTRPVLDHEPVLAAIRRTGIVVDLIGAAGDGPILMAFPDLAHRFSDGNVACLTAAVIGPTHRDPIADKPLDLSQTRGWDRAGAVLDETTHTVVVAEVMGRVQPPATRLRVFRTVLDAVIDDSRPALTWWPVSRTVLHPVVVQERPVAGLVNVRLFRDATSPGCVVMDTLGLGTFGLPDLQCHFRDLPTGQIASLFYAMAAYLIDGVTIEPGHTVQGLTPDQRWPVTRTVSLIEPTRAVLDLDPGQPYAARIG